MCIMAQLRNKESFLDDELLYKAYENVRLNCYLKYSWR